MPNPQEILNAARTLRSYLPDLVGDEAEVLDSQLASLLEEEAQGASVDVAILRLVRGDDRTRQWMNDYLDAEDDSTRMAVLRTYSQPGGDPDPIEPEKYVCPVNCDTIWYRQFAGQDIPICETEGHRVKLVPAGEATC